MARCPGRHLGRRQQRLGRPPGRTPGGRRGGAVPAPRIPPTASGAASHRRDPPRYLAQALLAGGAHDEAGGRGACARIPRRAAHGGRTHPHDDDPWPVWRLSPRCSTPSSPPPRVAKSRAGPDRRPPGRATGANQRAHACAWLRLRPPSAASGARTACARPPRSDGGRGRAKPKPDVEPSVEPKTGAPAAPALDAGDHSSKKRTTRRAWAIDASRARGLLGRAGASCSFRVRGEVRPGVQSTAVQAESINLNSELIPFSEVEWPSLTSLHSTVSVDAVSISCVNRLQADSKVQRPLAFKFKQLPPGGNLSCRIQRFSIDVCGGATCPCCCAGLPQSMLPSRPRLHLRRTFGSWNHWCPAWCVGDKSGGVRRCSLSSFSSLFLSPLSQMR